MKTKIAVDTIDKFFNERILPHDGDAKFADVWPIENIWGAIKEKIRGKEFKSETQLIREINKQWQWFTPAKCKQMMEKIPERLRKVINNKGNQVYEH